jgi:hypothetical protein
MDVVSVYNYYLKNISWRIFNKMQDKIFSLLECGACSANDLSA